MNLYDALQNVKKAAKPFTGGSGVTPETSQKKVSELGELFGAIADAKEAGATPYDIVEAVSGNVAMYLKD